MQKEQKNHEITPARVTRAGIELATQTSLGQPSAHFRSSLTTKTHSILQGGNDFFQDVCVTGV